MAALCSSIMWALPGFVSRARSSFLICSSLIGLVIPVHWKQKLLYIIQKIVGVFPRLATCIFGESVSILND